MVEKSHISDLIPDPRNARKHNPRNVGMVEHSIQRDGFGRSILVANDGTIIAGNATIEAAASAGIENVIVVESDGRSVIAVKRMDIAPDSPEFHALALSDNRAAELATWSPEVLAALADDGVDLSSFWFEPELDRILNPTEDEENFNPMDEWVGMPEFSQDDKEAVKQIIVNFATEDDVKKFARLVEQTVTMSTKSIWYPHIPKETKVGLAYRQVGADGES